MEISGTLTEFPLPELLQFLDKRRVTGCLSIEVFSEYYSELKPQQYGVWLRNGDLVLCQRQHCLQDVYQLAVTKQWMSTFTARKLRERSPNNIPAGTYLETQGVLDFAQLRSLFFSEVVHRVEALCSLNSANFRFRSTDDLPISEMSGLSIPATKVAKQGMKKAISSSIFSKSIEPLTHSLAVR